MPFIGRLVVEIVECLPAVAGANASTEAAKNRAATEIFIVVVVVFGGNVPALQNKSILKRFGTSDLVVVVIDVDLFFAVNFSNCLSTTTACHVTVTHQLYRYR